MSKIGIYNVEPDTTTLFTSKTLSFGSLSIKTPYKIFDLNGRPTLRDLDKIDYSYKDKIGIAEKSLVLSEASYNNFLQNQNSAMFADYSKKRSMIGDAMYVNALTLSFNPIKDDKSVNNLITFLNHYYTNTDILMIPNINIKSWDSALKKSLTNISHEDFIRYVALAYENLEYRNSKPIFVPLTFRYGPEIFSKILKEYLDTGYRYFWMDFEGNSVNKNTGFIRAFHHTVDSYNLGDEVVLYGSNIRREQNLHYVDVDSPGSDVLSSPLGFDLIGVNRLPRVGGFEASIKKVPTPEEISLKLNSKARILNSKNYMYTRFSDLESKEIMLGKYHLDAETVLRKPEFFSGFMNMFEMNADISIQRTIIKEDEMPLIDYFSGKKAIRDNYAIRSGIMRSDKKKKSLRKIRSRSLSDFI